MPTEAEIRQWVREEHETILREQQALCFHAKSGTLHGKTLICDQCGKTLVADNNGYWDLSHTRLQGHEADSLSKKDG